MEIKQSRIRLCFIMLVALISMIQVSGCARYARTVNDFYVPSATVSGGSGEVSIIMPESQQTKSPNIKWVLGKVTDGDNNVIDEVFSPRSPSEIIQAAFSQELTKAGFSTVQVTKRTVTDRQAIDLTKTEIVLEQVSELADIKAKCHVVVGLDVYKNGQLIKRLQYEATSSKTDVRDRDLLARTVLLDALQTVMLTATPELNGLFKP